MDDHSSQFTVDYLNCTPLAVVQYFVYGNDSLVLIQSKGCTNYAVDDSKPVQSYNTSQRQTGTPTPMNKHKFPSSMEISDTNHTIKTNKDILDIETEDNEEPEAITLNTKQSTNTNSEEDAMFIRRYKEITHADIDVKQNDNIPTNIPTEKMNTESTSETIITQNNGTIATNIDCISPNNKHPGVQTKEDTYMNNVREDGDNIQIKTPNTGTIHSDFNGNQTHSNVTSNSACCLNVTSSLNHQRSRGTDSTLVNTNWSSPLQYIDSTEAKVHYDKSWLCSFCGAVNRLLDTINIYDMECALCYYLTYIPGRTDIFMSYEWDHEIYSCVHIKHIKDDNDDCEIPKSCIRINASDAELLVIGLIRTNKCDLIHLLDIYIVKQISFYGNLPQRIFSWDNDYLRVHNGDSLIIDKHNMRCLNRTYIDSGSFKNAFGSRILQSPGVYEWMLTIERRHHSLQHSIAVGVIEADGVTEVMSLPFLRYSDAFGIWNESNNVRVTLEWSSDNRECRLLFNERVVYNLNAKKAYRFAVSMKEGYDRLTVTSMDYYL